MLSLGTLEHDRRWGVLSYAYGLLLAAVFAYFLLGLVVQVSDSFGNLLAVQKPTIGQLLREQFSQRAYLRPLLWTQIKVVYELAGGHYYAWFRGIQVVQLALLIALVIGVIRPRTWLDAALVPLALAVLTGAHTFAPLVREAFPINSFLTIAIACVAVAAIALRERPRWYTDVLAVLLFAVAVLTVETGLLIWVVGVAAALLGLRGLSRPALITMTVGIAVYLFVRIWVLDIGGPSLIERASGFGFGILEPADLTARFAGHAWIFYAYNIVSSISTVLFSEPKGGVWRFAYEITLGSVHPWTAVSVLSSCISTALIGWFVWTRRQQFRARAFDRDARIVTLFLIVLAANACISYPYTKNVIMSPAGVFLAAAVHVAARAWLSSVSPRRFALAVMVVTVLSSAWAFRVAGTYYNLRRTAAEQRAEWVVVDGWLQRQRIALNGDQAHALRDALRRDAIWNHPTPFQASFSWARWFDIDW